MFSTITELFFKMILPAPGFCFSSSSFSPKVKNTDTRWTIAGFLSWKSLSHETKVGSAVAKKLLAFLVDVYLFFFLFCFAVVVVVFLKLCGEWSAQEWTFCTDQCRSACVHSRSRLFTRDDDWATPSIKATSWNPLVAAVCCVDQTSSCYYQELRYISSITCYRGSHP